MPLLAAVLPATRTSQPRLKAWAALQTPAQGESGRPCCRRGTAATAPTSLCWTIKALSASLLSKLGLGEPPLQTLLTTSLKPFAAIRRERDQLYGAPFPTDGEFARSIERAAAATRAAESTSSTPT